MVYCNCLSHFCVAITNCLKLDNSLSKKAYLVHCFDVWNTKRAWCQYLGEDFSDCVTTWQRNGKGTGCVQKRVSMWDGFAL
jgi:hypothetical protein